MCTPHATFNEHDKVICDAGVGVNTYGETVEGLDRHMTVNHLGHMLLVNRLLPLIRTTSKIPGAPAPRIVSVSSELHRAAPSGVKFESVDELKDSSISSVGLHGRSKLANILFAKQLQRRLDSDGVPITVLAVHPGAVNTEGFRKDPSNKRFIIGPIQKFVCDLFFTTPSVGAYSTLFAAASPVVKAEREKYKGAYLVPPGKLAPVHAPQADSAQLAEELWETTEAIVKQMEL